jgi:hypothetical protein
MLACQREEVDHVKALLQKGVGIINTAVTYYNTV